MGTIVWLSDASAHTSLGGRNKGREPEDGRVFREIRVADGPTPEERAQGRPLVHPERVLPPGGADEYRAARKQGARHLVLWADPYRQRAVAHIRTVSAAKGAPATFEVLGEDGAALARITREPAMRGRRVRTRWTVLQQGAEPAAGLKGRPFWWAVWWLISPIQVAIAVGSLVAGSGDVARTPRRTRWRRHGRVVLDYANGPDGFELEVLEEGWDWRVTAALVALLTSHGSWLATAWDELAQ
ncbi:hypothetical protein [Streptomyces sp. NPDC018031]|uniref:hypothetical protein n=1 Tax=Streptomyces sp. NPDC018031 TaxID=3365033 RepID=UPI0037BB5845